MCACKSTALLVFTEFSPSSRRILNVAWFKWFLMLSCLLIFLCNISSTARDVLERCSWRSKSTQTKRCSRFWVEEKHKVLWNRQQSCTWWVIQRFAISYGEGRFSYYTKAWKFLNYCSLGPDLLQVSYLVMFVTLKIPSRSLMIQ